MRTIFSKIVLTIVLLISATYLTFGQNINQAAVDTLTKDVAIAIFAKINQPKAHEIYIQLLNCGDGCDPQSVIRAVGSWDAVGARIQELNDLKSTALFISMSPADANNAIRKHLADFYSRYKADYNYDKPFNPPVQRRILTKIDLMLPPAVVAESAPIVSDSPHVAKTPTIINDKVTIDPGTLHLGQLKHSLKEPKENRLWMLILSGITGLIIGAGTIYLLFYRAAQAEINALLDENNRLTNALESARRAAKPGNEGNSLRVDYRQKAIAYEAIIAELNTDNPLMVIRQLKQQNTSPSANPTRSIDPREAQFELYPSEPRIEPISDWIPEPVFIAKKQKSVSTPIKTEVFYLPPPSINSQFDDVQRAAAPSPELAYCFSIYDNHSDFATFHFEADSSRVMRFLTYRSYLIEPACHSENGYSPTHTRIVTIQDGQAILESGIWRVKTKARIRYE